MREIKVYKDYLIEENICKDTISLIDETIKQGIYSYKSEHDIRIYGFEKLLNKNISEILFDYDKKNSEKIFNILPKFQLILAGKTSYSEANLGSGNGWHRDSYIKPQMKTICYLTKVCEDSGPFCIINRSFRINRYWPIKIRIKHDYINKLNTPDYATITSDKPGLTFSCNTNYVHAGLPIKNKNMIRYALTVYSYYDEIDSGINNLIIDI